MGEERYTYDAFISYRHLPLDMAVAKRLQELLERYRPPRQLKTAHTDRIRRVFRDRTELPTSGDLGADIQKALLQSRYLVVICTEKTRESAWCMEEIRRFKAAHHGQNDRILVLLASGDPQDVFPEELRTEAYRQVRPDGSEVWLQREVEPLSADIRAETTARSLKLLRTEFLRIAAPILGCGFDDLYRRHLRRKRRTALTAGGIGFGLMAAVLSVISVFAWRTYVSEQNYRSTLADFYTRQGVESMRQQNLQEALMYYGKALELETEGSTAASAGAALLLQQNCWPYCVGQEPGRIAGGRPAAGAQLQGTGTEPPKGQDLGTFLQSSQAGDTRVFLGETEISFYEPESGRVYAVPRPAEVMDCCDTEPVFGEFLPAALPAGPDRAMVVYGGYVYLYDVSSQPARLLARTDLAAVFPAEAEAGGLSVQSRLWVSPDGSLAAVENGFGVAVYDTEALALQWTHTQYDYALNDVAMKPDGTGLALLYGNDYGIRYRTPGGFLDVYDEWGEQVLTTREDPAVSMEGGAFSEDGGRFLAWGGGQVTIWNLETGALCAVPLQLEDVEAAAFSQTGTFAVQDSGGMLSYFDLTGFVVREGEDDAAKAEETPEAGSRDPLLPETVRQEYAQTVFCGDGLFAAHDYVHLYLLREDGTVLGQLRLSGTADEMLYSETDACLYLKDSGMAYLSRVQVHREEQRLGEEEILDARGHRIVSMEQTRDYVAASSGGGQLLLYEKGKTQTQPARVLPLEHAGILQELAQGGENGLAVLLQITENVPDSYRFDIRYVLELWDMESGLPAAVLEPEGMAELTGLEYLPDGSLSYSRNGVRSLWQTAAGRLDPEAAQFLLALSCCGLDDAQNVVYKTPEPDLNRMGVWGNLLEPEETDGPSGMEEAAARTQQGEAADLAEFDRIWQELSEGHMAYTGAQLDRLFDLYWNQARIQGVLEEPGVLDTGLAAYLELNRQGMADPFWNGDVMGTLMDLMLETEVFDAAICSGFEQLAQTCRSLAETDEVSGDVYRVMAWSLQTYSGLLAGGGEECLAPPAGMETDQPLLTWELDALQLLYRNDPEAAAGTAWQWAGLGEAAGLEPEDMEPMFSSALQSFYVLERRGILDGEAFNQFLAGLPVYQVLRVSQLPPASQEAGLRTGDRILGLNGRYFSGERHARDLMAEIDGGTFLVLRDGQRLELARVPDMEFGAMVEFYWKETEDGA